MKLLIALLLAVMLMGCGTIQTQGIQSAVFSWDDQNADQSRKLVGQVCKNWTMNRAAIEELVGPKLTDAEHALLNQAVTGLTKVCLAPTDDANVGRGVILVGKLAQAGAMEIRDSPLVRMVEGLIRSGL